MFVIGLVVGLILALGSIAAAAPNQISIVLDGQRLAPDVAPVMVDGQVMVPLRFVAESLGASVRWNEITQTVFITTGNDHVPPWGGAILDWKSPDWMKPAIESMMRAQINTAY